MTREQIIKHWDVIQAFKEGKTIYSNENYEDRYIVDENPHFYIDSIRQTEYIAVEKNQYIINEYSHDKKQWFEENKCPNGLSKIYHRIRICGKTKRLPTIEEVEKWFLENKVFVYKETGTYERIMTFQKTHETPICNYDKEWLSIEEFCQLYSNVDGTELYITEN